MNTTHPVTENESTKMVLTAAEMRQLLIDSLDDDELNDGVTDDTVA